MLRKQYPEVRWTLNRLSKSSHVYTIGGRRIPLVDRYDKNGNLVEESRRCFSWVVQGSAADLLNRAILRLALRQANAKNPLDYRIWLALHDELILETPIGTEAYTERAMIEEMECEAAGMPFPVNSEILGFYWAEMET